MELFLLAVDLFWGQGGHSLLALKTCFLPEMWSNEMSPAVSLGLGRVS